MSPIESHDIIKVILLTASFYVSDIRDYNITFSVLSRSGVKGEAEGGRREGNKEEAEESGLYNPKTQATAYLKKNNRKRVCFIYLIEFVRFC